MRNFVLSFVIILLLAVQAEAKAPEVGSLAPLFTGKTAAGEEIHLADLRGKVVLLDFWASWCGPCREEMPFLVAFYRRHQKAGFEILSVNIDDQVENMRKFLSRLDRRPDFPILVDREKDIPRLYDIETMPTTVFIDRQGRIRFWHGGFVESHKDLFYRELKTLLGEK